MSHKRVAIIMRLIHTRPAYASVTWPRPHPGARSGPHDNSGLHAVCITGLVGLHDRTRQRQAGKTCPAAPQRRVPPAGDAQPIADLASDADERLFRAIPTDPSHVLRRLLPKPKHTGYLLRPRAHGYELPAKDEHNFISRMLYKNIYCPK